MATKTQDVKFEIINNIGVVSALSGGWNLELNRVSWNGNEPKYDIRTWSPDHTKMGKGITLSEKELISLFEVLDKEVAFLKQD
jgi:hypothetical protein